MSRWTTLIAAVIVAALGVAIWQQTEQEAPPPRSGETRLFDFTNDDLRELVELRIDNIERNMHMALVKQDGVWRMVDPIDYPVREDMLNQLFGILAQNRGFLVPEPDVPALREDLEKPRATLTLVSQAEGGERRTHELLMGEVDVDGMRVDVLVDGEVRRTMRNLETVLEVSVHDWRSRKALSLRHDSIVEIRREGYDLRPDGQVDLDLVARLEPGGWWVDRPIRFLGDPYFLTTWAAVLTQLSVDRFVSDLPDPELGQYGLATPMFSLTLKDRAGTEQTLDFGRPNENSVYFARRRGWHHVWTLDVRDFSMLFHEPRDLFDPVLVRLPREALETVRLLGEDWDIRLTQDLLTNDWTVAWREAGSQDEWTAEQPAAEEPVTQALTWLARPDTIAAYLWHEPVDEVFADAPTLAVWAQSGGARYGGRVGPVHTTEEGTRVRTFRREGEDLVSLVELEVQDILARSPEDYLSLELTNLSEPTLTTIEISRGDVVRRFTKTVQTTWLHADLQTNAVPELVPVIEHLLFLRAEAHLPRSSNLELSEVVTVRIKDRKGKLTQFEVGATPDGEVRALVGSRQSLLRHQGLHADLLEITRPPE